MQRVSARPDGPNVALAVRISLVAWLIFAATLSSSRISGPCVAVAFTPALSMGKRRAIMTSGARDPSLRTASNSFPDPQRCLVAVSSTSESNDGDRDATVAQDEARRLLERARAMRAEIATLEGRSVEEVEAEAKQQREQRKQVEMEQAAIAKAKKQQRRQEQEASHQSGNNKNQDGRFLTVPDTFDDQIWQARAAVERALKDGQVTQTVRFALMRDEPGETLLQEDRLWPGGARQMYREAAGPLTRALLRQVRPQLQYSVSSKKEKKKEEMPDDDDESSADSSQPRNGSSTGGMNQPPVIQSQDIYDFDGSALITAESALGPEYDVQAMVLPNTDVKYVKDIGTIREALGDDRPRLFLLVNPFWRNVESWGFNLLAPGAKALAQREVFDDGRFAETYCLLQTSVRGEDCVALKAYPYDWQLFAHADSDAGDDDRTATGGGFYYQYWMRLGSTKKEPTGSDFAKLLEERPEFRLSKNMRQMQRIMGTSSSDD